MTDLKQAFSEVYRILKTDGRLVLGMIVDVEPVRSGYGEGGFVVISAIKEKHDS